MKNQKLNLSISFLIALFCLAVTPALAQMGVSRSECFPFERLAPEQRQKAEELLLKALDGEALYTIVGGLKPMSSGFVSFQVQTRLPRQPETEAEKISQLLSGKKTEELNEDEKRRLNQAKQTLERRDALDKLEETRAILEKWRCGDELFASVQHFARPFDGKRFSEAVVFSRPRLRQMLTEKAEFFSRWGITQSSHPLDALYAVEHDATGARFGGYGYLFGYPDYAVRFFVAAADEEELTGKFVERDFYSIPTFGRERNSFVYAVPKGHAENETDKLLRARAEKIFAEYKRRRAEYIGDGKKGVVAMLRDWFCDAKGNCSPGKAKVDEIAARTLANPK
jgi:hypothetical protein